MKKRSQWGWARLTSGPRLIVLPVAALAGLALFLTAAFSAETNTVSKPAGFVRVVIPTNSEALVSTPFDPFNPDINNLLENQLTGATNEDLADAIRQWDPVEQAYTNAYKADFTGNSSRDGRWFTDFSSWSTSTLSFYPGDGFWIRNRQSATQTVYLCGTVVLGNQSTVTFGHGLSLFGYPFSSRISLNDTRFWDDGALGASVMTNADKVSDLIGGAYDQFWLLDNTNSSNHGKWVDISTNLSETVLGAGRGYWYQRLSTNSFDWQETRPYDNAFPTNDNPPYVAAMTLNSNKDEVALFIETTGNQGEKLDIYYKDVSETNAFTSAGWRIASINLPAGGQSVSWTDSGPAPRGKIDTVYARYYLIGRADLDTDGDGVPDSRETFVYGSNPNSNDLTVLSFIENFETNTVQVGDLNGQNKWIASPAGTALVQTNTVYQGQQALKLDSGTNSSSMARHEFLSYEQNIVWLDFHTKVRPAVAPTNLTSGSALFYFDANGKLVVYDGLQSGTNQWQPLTNQAPTGTWARISVKLDYSLQKWSVCLNSQDAAHDLGFATANTGFTAFTMKGKQGFADALSVTTNEPPDLSVDWDSLPNDWELSFFGNLDQPETGDPDGDGLTNLQEYQYGSNPTVNDKTTDSDNDGLSNYDELVLYGTDPSNADSDGDGFSDAVELLVNNTDPLDANSHLFPAWPNNMKLSFRDSDLSQPLTNFPVLVVLNQDRVNYAEFKAGGADLLFHSPAGAKLAHEIEQWDTNGTSYVWVNAPLISASGADNHMVMRWGNATATNEADSAEVWNSDYVGVWHLADADNAVADSTRYHWNGYNRGADSVEGRMGNGRHFDGASHIGLPADSLRTVGNGVSFSLWLRGDDARNPVGTAFQATRNFTDTLTGMMLDSAGKVGWWGGPDCEDRCSKTPQASEHKNQWNHWVFVKNPQSGVMTVYLNGASWLSASGKTKAYEIADAFTLGASYDGGMGYRGAMDEFRVSAKPLSADWVAAEHRAMTDAMLIYGGVTNLPATPPASGFNLAEYFRTLNAGGSALDTDGDGLPDTEELNVYGTAPTLADTDTDGTNDMTVAVSKTGVETSYRNGTWTETNGVLVALTDKYMRAEYELTPPEAGMYRLVVQIENTASNASSVTLRQHVLIDQIPVQWLDVLVPAGTNACGAMVTPWLTATNHTLRLAWLDDGASGKSLGIMALQLQQIHGSCTNATGRQDWMEAILAQDNDTDGDGLSDRDELDLFETDPLNPDTDGDTLSDGEEANLFLTDPLSADSSVTLACEFDGVDTASRSYWASNSKMYEDGSTLVMPEHWSSVDYAVTATNAGMHRLSMRVHAADSQTSNGEGDLPDDYIFGVQVSVDGFYVNTFKLIADRDRSGTRCLILPWLTAGEHTIKIHWQSWFHYWMYYLGGQINRRTSMGIDNLRLYSVNGSDGNTNSIPDWMERVLDTSGDTDGDGLSDKDEALVYHTDPLKADTDGDDLSDKEEILRGADPLDPDTDNDGVWDGEEALELHTNPLQAEFDGTVTNRVVIGGSGTNSVGGSWTVEGSEIKANDRRGWVQYNIDCPQADIYRVKVEATHVITASQCSPVEPIAASDLMIYIDGIYIGKKTLTAPQGIYGTVTMFTPYLTVGSHTVKVYWENVNSRVSLKIKQVTLQQYGGSDSNSNGVKDWVEASLGAINNIDKIHVLPSTLSPLHSSVSPVCIEGPGRYADMMSISVNSDTNAATMNPGILDRWYADVPLCSTGATSISISFQNGALTRSTNIAWVALNVIGAENLSLRKNDSLMLTAYPSGATNGTVTIQILQGATVLTNIQTTVDSPFTYDFASDGTYTINGSWQSGGSSANDSMTVTAIGGAFPAQPPACMIGYTRQWACTNMSANAVLESDDSVSLLWTNQTALLSMSAINKDHYLVARAWANGPVLAGARLDGFWIQAAMDGYVWIVETYPDGSSVLENTLIARKLPSSVDIQLKILIGGVTFDDMTLERWVTSTNLNAIGEYTFQVLRPASVDASICHTINAYQDGVFLGEAYYGGILMPRE